MRRSLEKFFGYKRSEKTLLLAYGLPSDEIGFNQGENSYPCTNTCQFLCVAFFCLKTCLQGTNC
jgi:hypothetical protein